jgi:hypothetical protein
MTETEWLSATYPFAGIDFLQLRGSERKFRLFSIACCELLIREVAVSERAKRAVEVAALLADNLVSPDAVRAAIDKPTGAAETACYYTIDDDDVRLSAISSAGFSIRGLSKIDRPREVGADQADLLRDIFGNPFRPVVFSPAWRSETVVALASAVYAERAFDRMPILADALEEAGCDHPDVLSHCRGPGPHVRGCWVVDAVLGKE